MINDIIICTLDLLFLLKILVILNIPRFKNGWQRGDTGCKKTPSDAIS